MTRRPNVVIVVLDDTGFGHLGCFGSDIATPTIDGLAAHGLRYNRFHVTSMCSPTRASVFTGRNHHAVGVGFVVDIPLALPGYNCHLPASAAPMPRLLRDAGYSTIAVGKWHLTPRWERSAAGPFTTWPLGYGFEHYYGFLQGDTNHWAPNLVRDNHYLDPPPTDGYHLTEDLVDASIREVLDVQQAAPGKPFFLYLALGATHAPHHVAPEWVAPYTGQFDGGWDEWRAQTFARQVATGVVPEGTALTERPPWLRAWADLSDDERRLHARQQEVYAGFLTHTDAQLGRLFAFLRDTDALDDTIVLVLSDNGASAEGGEHGTFNEHRFTSQVPETAAGNLAHPLDEWGGPRAYNHYSWGWAWAGNTPLKLWKRYAWLGGTRTPLVMHWPNGISARGEIRSQFVHAVDVLPTLLEAIGVARPSAVDGTPQDPMDGASFGATFADARSPSPRETQYFEMVGSRSIVHDGWKATTDHVSQGVLDEERLMTGSRDFTVDHWALYRLADDFSEAHDVSADHPDVVAELRALWDTEAERNHVLPMSDGLTTRLKHFIFPTYPPARPAVFRPGGSPIVDESVPMLAGGFRLTAEVDVPATGADGVLCALGDWNGGYALYASGGRLVFDLVAAGEVVRIASDVPIPPGRTTLGVSLVRETNTYRLQHGDAVVAELVDETPLPIAWQHGGAGLTIGYDRGLPVSDDCTPPFTWSGTIGSVTISTPPYETPPVSELTRAALRSD